MLHHIRQKRFAIHWKYSSGKFYSLRITHRTLLFHHLFASMDHVFAQQYFGSYVDVKKWLDEWFAAKWEDFTAVVSTNGKNV